MQMWTFAQAERTCGTGARHTQSAPSSIAQSLRAFRGGSNVAPISWDQAASEMARFSIGGGGHRLERLETRGRALARWFLGDLNALRIYINRQLVINQGQPPGKERSNADGSSSFRVFRQAEVPGFVIATSA